MLAAQDIKELLMLHTNDTHSRLEPISINDPNPEFAGKAGLVRRVTLIKEMRKQNKDLLLFDCGDSVSYTQLDVYKRQDSGQ